MGDKPTVRELHTEAMNIATEAMLQYHTSGWNYTLSNRLDAAAYKEWEAAKQIETQPENEPTRSILYRSAACLALLSGNSSLAHTLAKKGLEGTPKPSDKEILDSIISDKLDSSNIWSLE